MTDPKQIVQQAAAVHVLRERVKTADISARGEVLAALDAGDRLGATYDGQAFAAVSVANGRVTTKVTDPDALAKWVAEHYPTEVETKTVVRPAFLRLLEEKSTAAGEACGPGGELDVPGLVVSQGDPYVTIRATQDAGDIVARMVADGYLTPTGRLAIEGEVSA